MADLRRIIEIYLDVESNARKNLVNAALYDPTILNLYRGTQVLFRCHLMLSDATAYAPESTATWLFGIDNAYTRDKADLVVSANSQFNLSGDWDGEDIVGGKICWRVDLTTSALKDALADSASVPMYAALWMSPVGGSYTLMAHWDITVRNVAIDPTTAIAQDGISFTTMDLHNADITQIKTPTGGIYRLQNGALQLWNSTQSKWHTVSVAGAVGSELMAVGPGED